MESNVFIMEEPDVGFTISSTKAISTEKRILHVFWNRRQGELWYSILSTDDRENGEWVQSSPENSRQIEYFWAGLNSILNDAIRRGSPSEEMWNSIRLSLQGIGQNLFNNLVPSGVAERIQQWQSGFSVRVSTNEQWIPWELMYDGQDFLGNKFILTRYPRLKGGYTTPNRNRPKCEGFKKIRKIVNVIGGNIKKPETQRASKLFNQFPNSIIIKLLQEKPISLLVEALEQADILHFTCHGHLEPNLLQNSSGKSSIENLCLETVTQLPLKPGSFVFANACTSTTPVQTFSEFTSFGWEFYRQGADVFIGTLGIVPTKYAISFAENFYEELLQQDPKLTIVQAVAKAKKVAAQNNNFFWLLYCVYGNPDYYFKINE